MLAFIVYYRSRKQKLSITLVGYYLMVGVLLTAACFPAVRKYFGNTVWLYELAAFFTAVFIGYYFYSIFQSRSKKTTVVVLVLAYLAYALFRNLTHEGQRLFDSVGYSLVSASVAVYVFMYFHQVLNNVTTNNILREFNFWLASGYLVYFLGSFIIFLTYYHFTKKLLENHTEQGKDLLMALWGLHNVLLFVGAFSLLIGSLWIACRRKSI